MKKEELKPCPFCGAEPDMWDTNAGDWYIDCSNKDCYIQPGMPKPLPMEAAIAIWNRRSL
jgi:hypothetical protein